MLSYKWKENLISYCDGLINLIIETCPSGQKSFIVALVTDIRVSLNTNLQRKLGYRELLDSISFVKQALQETEEDDPYEVNDIIKPYLPYFQILLNQTELIPAREDFQP